MNYAASAFQRPFSTRTCNRWATGSVRAMSFKSPSEYLAAGSRVRVASLRSLSAADPIVAEPFSQRETVSAETPMCAAKSAPDQPRHFRKKRISTGVRPGLFRAIVVPMAK